MVVTVDRKAPVGSRIIALNVDGQPLDPEGRYKLASNNFMLAGGDGYGALGQGRVLIGATDGKLLANEVMVYVRELKTVTPTAGRAHRGAVGTAVRRRACGGGSTSVVCGESG